jgi:hypothetical protein
VAPSETAPLLPESFDSEEKPAPRRKKRLNQSGARTVRLVTFVAMLALVLLVLTITLKHSARPPGARASTPSPLTSPRTSTGTEPLQPRMQPTGRRPS